MTTEYAHFANRVCSSRHTKPPRRRASSLSNCFDVLARTAASYSLGVWNEATPPKKKSETECPTLRRSLTSHAGGQGHHDHATATARCGAPIQLACYSEVALVNRRRTTRLAPTASDAERAGALAPRDHLAGRSTQESGDRVGDSGLRGSARRWQGQAATRGPRRMERPTGARIAVEGPSERPKAPGGRSRLAGQGPGEAEAMREVMLDERALGGGDVGGQGAEPGGVGPQCGTSRAI